MIHKKLFFLLSMLSLPMISMADKSGVTATWPLDNGTKSSITATVSEEGLVSNTSFSLGTDLTFNADGETKTFGGFTFSQIGPSTDNVADDNETDAITFVLTPKKGLTYTPTNFSFTCSRLGTNGGILDVTAISGDKQVTLGTDLAPKRNNEYSDFTLPISGISANGNPLLIKIYIKKLGKTKEMGFRNFILTGDFSGTVISVPSYTLNVSSSDEKAGTISVTPAGNAFDEDTEIKLSTSENFGYHFAAWEDDNGNTVSTENPYVFNIKSNTNLKALYTKKNVYALNLSLTEGARNNLVKIEPSGNIVNGIHHYEEGTDVKLTAINNKVLTFINWEDNTTTTERTVKMDGNQNVIATFSAAEYIVGWDLYDDQPAQERAADYKSDSENAGLLSLHNISGSTTSWLSLGSQKGGQNGKYGARVWKNMSDQYYFEISFSSIGYKNIKISNAIGNDYNSYSSIIEQYSTDGKTYKEAGRFTVPNRGWDSRELSLPTDADNQSMVHVRWVADSTSVKTGVSSDYDGTSIAEIFVTAESNSGPDDKAPELVATNPIHGATSVSASGSIILSFNEKIKSATGRASLGNEQITPIISGKNAVFKYQGLDYATEYTFTLPAQAITDMSGNDFNGCSFSFTTMERKQPEARLYDAVVAQDGSGDHTSIQEAIDAAPTGRTQPWLIFVKKGNYIGHIDIPSTKPYIHLIGQHRSLVSISADGLSGGDNAKPVDTGSTLTENSDNCYFEGINFVNSYGVEHNSGPQALALYTKGDRIILNKCGMLSYQDTWLTARDVNNRQYSKDCFIEGAVDFIYGQGNVYFDSDTLNIVRKSGGYIIAPNHDPLTTWGYVFQNTLITAPGVPSETSVWLGRPWHGEPKTVFINTKAEVTIPAGGWVNHMGGLPKLWAEYNTMDGNGNPVDLSHRNTRYWILDANGDSVWSTAKAVLSAEEAAQYTIKNVLGGADGWQPAMITESCDAPIPHINGNKIEWAAVPYAICYVVIKDGNVAGFTTTTEYPYEQGMFYQIQAVNEYGGLSEAGTAQITDHIDKSSLNSHKNVLSIHNIDGKSRQALSKGINIVQYDNGQVKKIVK